MFRLLVALLLIASPSVSAAQATQSVEQVRTNAKMHFGPFYLTPGIRLEEFGWDSNVFNEESSERKSDFTFTLSPKADVWMPITSRALISTTLDLDLVWYAKYKNQRSVNPLASVTGALFLNRLTASAGYEHLTTRERASAEIDLRADRVEGTARLRIEYRFTPKFSLGVAGERRATDFEENQLYLGTDLEQSLDRFTGSAGATASYELTPLTTIRMSVARGVDRFSFSPERDSDSWSAGPRIEFKPRALIQGFAAAGVRWLTPKDDASLEAFRGLVMEAGLSYTLRGATVFDVAWGRNVSYSFSPDTPYYIDNRLAFSVRQSVGRSFDVLVSTDRHVYDYRSRPTSVPGVFAIPEPDLSDVSWNSAGSVGYRLGRNGRIGAGVVHMVRRASNPRLRDYERLQYTVTFSYGLQ